ncbi:MAG: ROK family protein [Rubellimicrobium sp.]|nr:ROK family protein [Rubellimicrobium sp.]
MIAAGIDLGGTKIEAQVFAPDWTVARRRRVDTPHDYDALVAAMAEQVTWASGGDAALPVGIAAAGLVNPASGLAYTANLPATGRPFPADIAAAAGRPVTYVNDCRALALSEAVFGAGRGLNPVAGLILGTGVGGGVVVNGQLLQGPSLTGGEFGHFALPAHVLARHGLPLRQCGCGRTGCTETYLSGPGLSHLAQALTGSARTPREIAAGRSGDPALARVWEVWCELAAELVITLTFTIDPEVVVLGGGLSQIAGIAGDLAAATARAQLPGFHTPLIRVAQGGDASGARGAAHAALQETGHA